MRTTMETRCIHVLAVTANPANEKINWFVDRIFKVYCYFLISITNEHEREAQLEQKIGEEVR